MKKLHVFIFILSVAFFVGTSHSVSAETTEPTGSSTVQKALETVKETIDNLVTAKDEQKSTVALRISALKKAVALSLEEAKSTRVKLLALDDLSDEYETWRDAKVVSIKSAIDYFDTKRGEVSTLEKSDEINESVVRSFAENFKIWRDTYYIPVMGEVQNYFLISEETKSITTAEKRLKKVSNDVATLDKKAKKTDDLKKLLTQAETLISDSKDLNTRAESQFKSLYLPKPKEAPSPEVKALKKEEVAEFKKDIESTDATVAPSTETNVSAAPYTPPSIRDLVTDSSQKVKDSYKVFIEMSNLVRRLLK